MGIDNLTGVILSAGKGSRIDPFNSQFPKPLLPVANRPIMEHHLEIFKSLGISEVKIVVGHLMDRIISHFGNGEKFGVHIEYIEQQNMLGIAHAVGHVENHVNGPILLVLGDIFYEPVGIDRMITSFEKQGGGAVIAVMEEEDPELLRKNFSVELDDDGNVRRVIEKPTVIKNNIKGCGIYLFGQEIFDAVSRTPRTALRDEYEITSAIQIMIDNGHMVAIENVVESDNNITFPRDLLRSNLDFLQRRGMDNIIAESAEVHPGATIERSVIGDRVRITDAAQIVDSVVLPDAVIDSAASISRVIVSTENWFQC